MGYLPPEYLELYVDDITILHEFIEWLKAENRIIAKDGMIAGPVPELRTTEEIVCEYLGIEYESGSNEQDDLS